MNLSSTEYHLLLRQDFYAFTQRCFLLLNPGAEFMPNWHLEVMAAKLEAVFRGEITRLIINVPPRSLKSMMASVAFPAWWLGHRPSAQLLNVSYAQDLSNNLALGCRSVMSSDFYKRTFRTRLSHQKNAVAEFMTTLQGTRLATSIGGVLTGRGADVIIIDDPLKPDEALSEVQRKSTNHWFSHTLLSRLNSKETGAIVLIMQRLHEDDLVGHLMAQGGWELLSFPAIARDDEVHHIVTPYGPQTFTRKEGEVLHPERESRDVLRDIQANLGSYHYAAQYQQTPAPLGGGMIKVEWFKRYEFEQLPQKFDYVLQSWDTACKPSEFADFSVCTTWGVIGKQIYLLNLLRKRASYPDLKRLVIQQQELFNPREVLIEDKGSGTQLIQDLNQERNFRVVAYKPESDKIVRMDAQTAVIEGGFVHIPKEAAWLDDYLHEISTFPKGKYDDQIDSTSQALDWIKTGARVPAALTYMRMLSEKNGFDGN